MTRRAWIAIALALAVNLTVVAIAVALDSRRAPGAVASVDDVRVARPAPPTSRRPRHRPVDQDDHDVDDPARSARAPAARPPRPSARCRRARPGAPLVSRVPTTDRVVFVTIDDGLVQDPAVVDTVRRMRIPVTHVPRPRLREAGPGLLPAARRPGRPRRGPHGEPPGPQDALARTASTRRSADRSTRSRGCSRAGPLLFRPPGGSYNATTQSIAASCGYRYVVNWTAAANDGRIDWQAGVDAGRRHRPVPLPHRPRAEPAAARDRCASSRASPSPGSRTTCSPS